VDGDARRAAIRTIFLGVRTFGRRVASFSRGRGEHATYAKARLKFHLPRGHCRGNAYDNRYSATAIGERSINMSSAPLREIAPSPLFFRSPVLFRVRANYFSPEWPGPLFTIRFSSIRSTQASAPLFHFRLGRGKSPSISRRSLAFSLGRLFPAYGLTLEGTIDESAS